jgi:type II secretory pathway pseudopilin PulG
MKRLRKARGVAVLVVLLMLATVLALSYAAVRSQFQAVLVQRNADRQAAARAAAQSGLTAAIRKMHTNAWGGVDTSLSGRLGEYESFLATYATGDSSLVAGSPDYDEWPWRVTVESTGYAADPDRPQHIATHKARAVLRLVPRALSPAPPGFSDVTSHTVCQWTAGDFILTPPARIEGPVRIRATLDLGRQINWEFEPRWHYLDGLRRLRESGQPDWRPFTGPVRLPSLWQYLDTLSVLNTALGVATENTSMFTAYAWTSPASVQSYRLYPGGRSYTPPTLPEELRNQTLQPDAKTNPLGLFYRVGRSRVRENVTLRGTLVTVGGSEVEFDGAGARFASQELPPLFGADEPIRLPTIVGADGMILKQGADVELTGMVLLGDEFEVRKEHPGDIVLRMTGRLAAKNIYVHVRKRWDESSSWWQSTWNAFWSQRDAPGGTDNFVVWLNDVHKLHSAPDITIKPDDQPIRYHWQDLNQPIYVPAAGDDGLRWEVIAWTDNP